MKFEQLKIKDIVLITPDVFEDNRGYFYEAYNIKKIFQENNINSEYWKPTNFVQDSLGYNNKKNTIRGLHYQEFHPQAKLVTCIKGAILDVVVDIRKDSDTFGEWLSVELDEYNNNQLWIPHGFAHGYKTLTDDCAVIYKTDEFYKYEDYRGLIWNDPYLNIDWKNCDDIVISEQDTLWKSFKDTFDECR